jgi:cytochrome c biogenesis protein CcdA
MAVEAYLPTLGTVIVTGAIDAINPCAIGVLILMISVLIGSRASTRKMLFLGGVYILGVFLTYLLAGLGLMYYFATLPLAITEYISIGVGLFIIAAGVIEIKDFFWYGKGFSLHIPVYFANKIQKYSTRISVPGLFLLGAFVSLVELPCTGGPYLAIITILSQYFDFTAFLMLVLYNIIFVLPLIIILVMVASGVKLYKVKKWKQEARGHMRLAIGLLLVAMGWLLILIANGTINLG